GVTRDERKPCGLRRRADQRIERVAGETELVGDKYLWRAHVERLIRGVAEQILEEGSYAPAQIDAGDPREEAALPHHNGGHVENGLAALAAVEEGGGVRPELAAAGGVEHEGVRIGHSSGRISHGAASSARRHRR